MRHPVRSVTKQDTVPVPRSRLLSSLSLPPVEREPLPQADYDAIFARVPRLTVEVVITGANSEGVLLSRRQRGPCRGLWHIPGGTVRFGEPLTESAKRVVRQELGLEVAVGPLIGYIEYPSHLALGDWPVGMAFRATLSPSSVSYGDGHRHLMAWFSQLPEEMHEEQKVFLRHHRLAG